LQQISPASAPHSRAANEVTARIVNGQFQAVGTERLNSQEASQVDSNLIFPPVTAIRYAKSVSPSSTVNNSSACPELRPGRHIVRRIHVVNANGQVERNSVITQTKTLVTLKSVVDDRPSEANMHVRANLAPTHLIGPFIRAGPSHSNTFVSAVRTTHDQPLTNGLQRAHLQTVPSSLKGHSTTSGLQMVLPVLNPAGIQSSASVNRVILPQPISLEGNKLTIDKMPNLVCAERLVASPDLQDRMFRPVSPASSSFSVSSSQCSPRERFHFVAPSEFHSQCRARRSICTSPDVDRRGSVEEELADQSYECALREAANSPDLERYLRCESPVTVMTSPNSRVDCSSRGDTLSESLNGPVNSNRETENIDIPSTSMETCEVFVSPKTPEALTSDENEKDDDASKRKSNSAMVRRLEPKLPSPVRERAPGDLYRDPSELTREERALQRAMMQFSEMEMKEKAKQIQKEELVKRRLRKRDKDKTKTIVNGKKEESAAKIWLKKFKRRRLWFSQRRSITVKQAGQEDNSMEKNVEDQPSKVKKRRPLNLSSGYQEQATKRKRKAAETAKQPVLAKPEDGSFASECPTKDKDEEDQVSRVSRLFSSTRNPKNIKKETLQESTSCKKALNAPGLNMGKRLVKRAKIEIEPLPLKSQEVVTPKSSDAAKADRSHRIKTYMLVTSYQGFRDFKPVVLESRTRGKSRQTTEESPDKSPKATEFPLLVVESVKSKTVKNSVVAESKEVQNFVESCLKARGKWQVDETKEEEGNDEDTLKEARKLNVNRTTGETILHKAARLGYHETVYHHIHQGIDPNAKDNAGWTPLHEACSRGKVEVVKVLTKYGADVNACSNDGIRPIHDAAEGGHVDVLRVLLSYGADPLLATYSGNSALSCSKEQNSRAFLKGVLEDHDLKTLSSSADESEGCWQFSGSCSVMDESTDHTCGIFEGVPSGKSVLQGEFEMWDKPHFPTYNLPVVTSNNSISGRRNYVLLSDVLEHLRISRAALLKKIKKLEIREIPWSEFLTEIADKPLCIPPKCSPADSSAQEGVAELIPVNYSLRRLLNIRVESVMMT